ncbi:ThuA domain-containing protein [Paraflavisolibacter sp. H34]|uniref:ThuA domain-containing protein n=1 Tax=Huijunlia imazamoxiresistens TaxID=3127457 RepID=UPI0030166FFB
MSILKLKSWTAAALYGLFLFGAVTMVSAYCRKEAPRKKVLVFSKTAGFHHASIADGNRALLKLGADNGFGVDTTTDAAWFTSKQLQQYTAVVFLNTTGDVLNPEQQAAFEAYIRGGGGYAGVHAASDTEYDWPWFGRLTGAYFTNHPKPQEALLHVTDGTHPSTRHLPLEWKRFDEWYNFKNIGTDLKVLLTIDEKSYEGGKNGDPHPMAWYHAYEGGRAFYTALGHTSESYSDPLFLQHLLGGIQYAIGK